MISQAILRTLIIYLVVLLVMRIMGKREIGELSTFDLVVTLIIAELAAIPMEQTEIPLLKGLLPIITLTAIQITFSFLCLKIVPLRVLIYGRPTVLIQNGQIKDKEMKKSRYNIEDLMMQLREKNIYNINDVEFAVLERSGDLSVIPKSQKRPLTPEDLKISTPYEGICLPLIIDGQIQKNNLHRAGLQENSLKKILAKRGIANLKNVFFASLDTRGHLYVDLKD